jgi:four helix bundle protein
VNKSQESRVKSQDKKTIKSFTDLIAWQKAHALAVAIYRNTVVFPASEQFGLTNQIRRAAGSVTSNITEGFGRRTKADRTHFYDVARASLAEVQNQLLLARDVGYLPTDAFGPLAGQSIEAHKLLTGLINATKERKS